MNRFLFRLALLSIFVLMSAVLILKTIGTFGSSQVVMVGLETACADKVQPCWYGVTLGETTTDEVKTTFEKFGDTISDNSDKGQLEILRTAMGGCFAQFVYGRGGSKVINEIILTNCSGVRLGDLLAYYGEPETIGTTITCDKTHAVIQHDHYFIEYPTDGILAAINRPAELRPWLSLHGTVRQLYLVKPHQSDGRKTWAGVVSFERFVRLHPEQIRSNGCGP